MKYNPNIHNRRSIRLKGYDYSQAGAYFVTICTQNREYMFGDVVDGKMVLNDAGRMVQTVWDEIPENYCGIGIDEFVIMPDHVHGIIVLVGATPRGRPDNEIFVDREILEQGQPRGVARTTTGLLSLSLSISLSLPDVVHRFKTMTTKQYTDGVKHHGWPAFPGKLWQRNYYEHIIRNEIALNRIRQYIINNPMKWERDRERPRQYNRRL